MLEQVLVIMKCALIYLWIKCFHGCPHLTFICSVNETESLYANAATYKTLDVDKGHMSGHRKQLQIDKLELIQI